MTKFQIANRLGNRLPVDLFCSLLTEAYACVDERAYCSIACSGDWEEAASSVEWFFMRCLRTGDIISFEQFPNEMEGVLQERFMTAINAVESTGNIRFVSPYYREETGSFEYAKGSYRTKSRFVKWENDTDVRNGGAAHRQKRKASTGRRS